MAARVLLIRPGPGAPELLPLEAWQALTAAPVFVAPGEPLGERLREAGIGAEEVAEAAPERLAEGLPPGAPEAGRRLRLVESHAHDETPPGARDLADRLASLAAEHGEIAFVLPSSPGAPDEAITRAVLERALAGDVEVEVVIGRQPRGHVLLELVRVMARLRGPGGCPWDHEQTHRTLIRYLLDETYELIEAVETKGPAEIAEELGDLLLQPVFHAQIGADEGTFDVDDVADRIVRKLVSRHPHVFAGVEVTGAEEVVSNWDAIKQREKGRESALEGITESLPALAYAQKVQRRAGEGWRSDAAGRLAAASRALERGAGDEAIGEALLALAALAGEEGVDAEGALRRAARRFRERMARVEDEARSRGISLPDLSPEERARLWEESEE